MIGRQRPHLDCQAYLSLAWNVLDALKAWHLSYICLIRFSENIIKICDIGSQRNVYSCLVLQCDFCNILNTPFIISYVPMVFYGQYSSKICKRHTLSFKYFYSSKKDDVWIPFSVDKTKCLKLGSLIKERSLWSSKFWRFEIQHWVGEPGGASFCLTTWQKSRKQVYMWKIKYKGEFPL